MKLPCLPLMPALDEQTLKDFLQKANSKPVFLTLTRNTVSMLSIRERDAGIFVRLHRMFLNADTSVLDEIGTFIKKRKKPILKVREFILRNQTCLDERKPRAVSINTSGRHYHLQEIFDELNKEYFSGTVTAAITWGKRSPRRAVRKRRLGSFQRDRNIIRVNPALDSNSVPRYFIEFVVYHEMLHAAGAVEAGSVRQRIHSREFKRRERDFKWYEQALAWERKSTEAMMRQSEQKC
jgi:predicted metal-dependent hydrolase